MDRGIVWVVRSSVAPLAAPSTTQTFTPLDLSLDSAISTVNSMSIAWYSKFRP